MASKKKSFIKKLQGKSLGELLKTLKEHKRDLFMLRMKNAVRALKKTHLIGEKRKDIARIKTVLATKKAEK